MKKHHLMKEHNTNEKNYLKMKGYLDLGILKEEKDYCVEWGKNEFRNYFFYIFRIFIIHYW